MHPDESKLLRNGGRGQNSSDKKVRVHSGSGDIAIYLLKMPKKNWLLYLNKLYIMLLQTHKKNMKKNLKITKFFLFLFRFVENGR